MNVGFQGEAGAFSDQAAFDAFGQVQTRGYRTFDDLIAAADFSEVAYGILPCENTITGAIAPAYDALAEHPRVQIIGETTQQIEQCLIGLPDADVEGIAVVLSHPVALDQCRRFLGRHPQWQAKATGDTAGAIREIVGQRDKRFAAIGPAAAASRYNACILSKGIQDDADNFTRFFIVSASHPPAGLTGRTCVALNLQHRPGSLHAALGALAAREVNLRSLLARPNRRRPFEYTFYLEMEAASEIDAAGLLRTLDPSLKVLGRY